MSESGIIPKVYSYPRSGTHLLMALLWENFRFPDMSAVVGNTGMRWEGNGEKEATVPWAGLFGSHLPWSRLVPKDRAIYIVRHPYRCFRSLWRVSETKIPFVRYLDDKQILAWKHHVHGYLRSVDCPVWYEDLIKDQEREARRIEQQFGLARKHDEIKPIDRLVGWSPSRNRERHIDTSAVRRLVGVLGSEFAGYDIGDVP